MMSNFFDFYLTLVLSEKLKAGTGPFKSILKYTFNILMYITLVYIGCIVPVDLMVIVELNETLYYCMKTKTLIKRFLIIT